MAASSLPVSSRKIKATGSEDAASGTQDFVAVVNYSGKTLVTPHRNNALVWVLRVIGSVDMTAIVFVVAPRDLINASHRWLGLREFPHEPVAGYLIRCTSIWYVIYGLLLWFVSFDVQKYQTLIRFLAVLLMIQGIVIAGVDLSESLPTWWVLSEGLGCFGIGASLFWLSQSARPAT